MLPASGKHHGRSSASWVSEKNTRKGEPTFVTTAVTKSASNGRLTRPSVADGGADEDRRDDRGQLGEHGRLSPSVRHVGPGHSAGPGMTHPERSGGGRAREARRCDWRHRNQGRNGTILRPARGCCPGAVEWLSCWGASSSIRISPRTRNGRPSATGVARPRTKWTSSRAPSRSRRPRGSPAKFSVRLRPHLRQRRPLRRLEDAAVGRHPPLLARF
jgi:hypothetical protein